MAALSDADRTQVWAKNMRENLEEFGLTKVDLRAAVDAIDDYLVANAAALNSAIPQPARSALSTSQKAKLLVDVVTRRYITGAS